MEGSKNDPSDLSALKMCKGAKCLFLYHFPIQVGKVSHRARWFVLIRPCTPTGCNNFLFNGKIIKLGAMLRLYSVTNPIWAISPVQEVWLGLTQIEMNQTLALGQVRLNTKCIKCSKYDQDFQYGLLEVTARRDFPFVWLIYNLCSCTSCTWGARTAFKRLLKPINLIKMSFLNQNLKTSNLTLRHGHSHWQNLSFIQ